MRQLPGKVIFAGLLATICLALFCPRVQRTDDEPQLVMEKLVKNKFGLSIVLDQDPQVQRSVEQTACHDRAVAR